MVIELGIHIFEVLSLKLKLDSILSIDNRMPWKFYHAGTAATDSTILRLESVFFNRQIKASTIKW